MKKKVKFFYDVGRPQGQSGQFIMRGSSHVQYQFQPTRVCKG